MRTVTVGEEIFHSRLTGGGAGRPIDMTEIQRSELSERLAAFDGDPGFDPRPAIEAMATPGLCDWGERDGSIPYPESREVPEDVIDWIAAQFDG